MSYIQQLSHFGQHQTRMLRRLSMFTLRTTSDSHMRSQFSLFMSLPSRLGESAYTIAYNQSRKGYDQDVACTTSLSQLPPHFWARSRLHACAYSGQASQCGLRSGRLLRLLLNGYLVLQGKMHLRTAQSKDFLKLLARERLGTCWAKYPFMPRRWPEEEGGLCEAGVPQRPRGRGDAQWICAYIHIYIYISIHTHR